MNTVCLDDLKMLLEKREGLHVSIFMPTHHVGGASKEDVIRFKNLVKKAESGLIGKGMRSPEAKVLMASAERLIQDALFWRQQADGLAMFLAPGLSLYYNVPIAMEELVAVSDRFNVKPLISLLSGCSSFYLLALSQGGVKLLQMTRFGGAEVKLPDSTPKSLAEELKNLVVPGKQVRYHSGTGSVTGSPGIIFHGAGLPPNYDKDQVLHFFNRLNKGVNEVLNKEKSPLVLMGVEYLLPLYRQANTYPYLIDEGITGNPELLTNDQLRQKGWEVIEPHFNKTEKEAVGQYEASAGTGQASNQLKEVLYAAYYGRVRFLFTSRGVQQWGKYAPESDELVIHKKPEAGDQDLLDFAALYTLTKDGTVFVLEPDKMPQGAQIAAVFRY